MKVLTVVFIQFNVVMHGRRCSSGHACLLQAPSTSQSPTSGKLGPNSSSAKDPFADLSAFH